VTFLLAVVLAACESGVSHGADNATKETATTTTVAPTTTIPAPIPAAQWLTTYGGIFATLLNDLAAANTNQPTGNETGLSVLQAACRQLQTDVRTTLSYPPNANQAAAAAFNAMLNQDISGPSPLGQTINAGTLAAAPAACLSDPDPLDTYGKQSPNDHLFTIIAAAPALIQAAEQTAEAAAPGVSAPASKNPVAVVPQVLVNQSGSGAADLPVFTVPSNSQGWTLAWSYNCSSYGRQGNFIISIYVSNGGDPYNQGSLDTYDPGVNELGSSGNNIESYTDAGTFALKVNSECSWTVKVAFTPASAYGT